MKWIFAALWLSILPALADTHPAFLPSRDVTITYNIAAPGQADTNYQLEYQAANRLGRINNPAQGNYFLVDLAAGTAQMVVPALQSVVNAPDLSAIAQQITSADQARFTPLGSGVYAGMACNKYLVLNNQGSGTACIMPDGVILHFTGHDSHGAAEITATSVSYGPAPESDFAAPQGYNTINLPPGALQQLLGQ